jgi:hypothetical protein
MKVIINALRAANKHRFGDRRDVSILGIDNIAARALFGKVLAV